MKGLDEIGCPYVTNAALDATDLIWIHDDPIALKAALDLPRKPLILAGPNIHTLPQELPTIPNNLPLIWLHPAPWVQRFWETFGTQRLNSTVWPVGIDTNKFSPTTTAKDLILVYNKQRSPADTNVVCQTLENHGEKFAVITYGQYQESNYQELLDRSKAIIWVGRSESQGIALLEALAMNVPALIWDIEKFGDWSGSGQANFSTEQLNFTPVTSAPYFDDTCGLKFSRVEDLEKSLTRFLEALPTFAPRVYIENNLSLAKQAQAFLNIYQTKLRANESQIKDTNLKSKKSWKNASLAFKLTTLAKDAVRQIMR
ncbi:MAG TPA: hypothetical protein PKA42_01230 [Candidatus Paceibacterota bacterium]|nr:hypothetical protein [Candidatus Paceibacterota bacterium]HMO82766.1 hypothetical protein [Candidatus Paceibacterota bacterium]